MKYQSELIKEIVDKSGHIKSTIHYQSECIEQWIEENKGAYPKLCDYESEWLYYINEKPIGEFPYETITDVTEATVNNVVPYAYRSVILKGNTKYRDIDTREVLDAFEDGRNLELVSVIMPVLTTSNEDDTKSLTLSTPSDLELKGIGDVKDELDVLTGEVTERIDKIVFDGSDDEPWRTNSANYGTNTAVFYMNNPIENPSKSMVGNFKRYNGSNFWTSTTNDSENFINDNNNLAFRISKTRLSSVDLNGFREWLSQNPIVVQYILKNETTKIVEITTVNENGENVSFKPIEGTMHVMTNGTPIKPTVTIEVPVEAITQNLMSFVNIVEEE